MRKQLISFAQVINFCKISSSWGVDPTLAYALEWKHWHRILGNYVENAEASATEEERESLDKIKVLTNCLSHNIYDNIEMCKSY